MMKKVTIIMFLFSSTLILAQRNRDSVQVKWPTTQKMASSAYDGYQDRVIFLSNVNKRGVTDTKYHRIQEWDIWNNIPTRSIIIPHATCSSSYKDNKYPYVIIHESFIEFMFYCGKENKWNHRYIDKKSFTLLEKKPNKKPTDSPTTRFQFSSSEKLNFSLKKFNALPSYTITKPQQVYARMSGINNKEELEVDPLDSLKISYENGNYIYEFDVDYDGDTTAIFYKDYFKVKINDVSTIIPNNYVAGAVSPEDRKIAFLKPDFKTVDIFLINAKDKLEKVDTVQLIRPTNGSVKLWFNKSITSVDDVGIQSIDPDNSSKDLKIKWENLQIDLKSEKYVRFDFIETYNPNIVCIKGSVNLMVNLSNGKYKKMEDLSNLYGERKFHPSTSNQFIMYSSPIGLSLFNTKIMSRVAFIDYSITKTANRLGLFNSMQAIGSIAGGSGNGQLLQMFPYVDVKSNAFKTTSVSGWLTHSVDGSVYATAGFYGGGREVIDAGRFSFYGDSTISNTYTHYFPKLTPGYEDFKWTAARSIIKKKNGTVYYTNSDWLDSDQSINPEDEQFSHLFNQLDRKDSSYFVNILSFDGKGYQLEKTLHNYLYAYFINESDCAWLVGLDRVDVYDYIKDTIVESFPINEGIPTIITSDFIDIYRQDSYLPFASSSDGRSFCLIDNKGDIHDFEYPKDHSIVGRVPEFINSQGVFSFSPNLNWILYGNSNFVTKAHISSEKAEFVELPDSLFKWFERDSSYFTNDQYQILNRGGLIPVYWSYLEGDTIPFYKYPSKDPVFTFRSPGSKWLFTAGNYFYGDKDVVKYISYDFKGKDYPYTQFDHIYNRPDTMMRIISDYFEMENEEAIQMLKKAYKKRLKRMGIQSINQSNQLPTISVTNLRSIQKVSSSIDLNVVANSQSGKIREIIVEINNVPVHKKHFQAKKIEEQVHLDLADGFNLVKVYGVDDLGNTSIPLQIPVFKKKQKDLPKLYLVSLGVGNYEDESINLKYATKDANDIAQKLSQSKAYSEVKSKVYTDENVTKSVVPKIKEFLKETTINDDVILFYAGHGIVDAKLDYYLATHAIDVHNPSKEGLAYHDLESIINSAQSLRKVIILDACHSGEIDKEGVKLAQEEMSNIEENIAFRSVGYQVESKLSHANTLELSKSLFNDLRRGSGATVVSSAGGMEFAIESDSWQNGLFTYSFLSGIESMDADLDNDGEVWLSEIQDYVQNKVSKLSNGNQLPTSRLENELLDLRLW